jgi:hypothetical protein
LECNETVLQLFIDFKKVHDSVRREVLYSTIIKFGLPMKPVRLIKMCLNGIYSKVCIGQHFSDNFALENDLIQRDALSPLVYNLALK